MKTIISTISILALSAGLAFAQSNVATVSQTANKNDVDIAQSANLSGSATAIVTQTRDANKAYLDQTGLNTATVSQQNVGAKVSGLGGLPAAVQLNDGGAANVLDVLQNSSHSRAYISQIGSANNIDLDVVKLNPFGGHANIQNLDQQGSANDMTIDVQGAINWLDATQFGDQNNINATVIGKANGNGSRNNDIIQNGSSNDVLLNISSSSNNAFAFNQDGAGNKITSNISLGDENSANVQHTGDDNQSTVIQTGSGNGLSEWMNSGTGNDYSQSQVGDLNRSRIETTGDFNEITLTQTGNSNRFYTNNRGTGTGFSNNGPIDNNVLAFTQDGDNNIITGGVNGLTNTVTITQTGSENKVGTQAGFWQADGFRVVGELNNVTIDQLSSQNSAIVTINGNSNITTITQN